MILTLLKWYGVMLGIIILFELKGRLKTKILINKVNKLNVDKFDFYSKVYRLAEFRGVTFEVAVKALLDTGNWK